jgi:hypothetical protein
VCDSAGELGDGMAKLGILGWWWNGRGIRSEGRGTGIERSGLDIANRGSALFAVGGRPFDFNRIYVSHFFRKSLDDSSMLDEKYSWSCNIDKNSSGTVLNRS